MPADKKIVEFKRPGGSWWGIECFVREVSGGPEDQYDIRYPGKDIRVELEKMAIEDIDSDYEVRYNGNEYTIQSVLTPDWSTGEIVELYCNREG